MKIIFLIFCCCHFTTSEISFKQTSNYLFESVKITFSRNSSNGNFFVDFRPFAVIPKKETWNRIVQINLNGTQNELEVPCHHFVHRGIYKFYADDGTEDFLVGIFFLIYDFHVQF